ncbi:MAG: hypothetical protein OQK67_06490 [Chlorobium sp.]|nr:hypothetical protein [Chlorobium sp.]
MKMYALVMVMLAVLAGCKTTYKGSIEGADTQQESKSGVLVNNATGESPSAVEVNR